MKTSDSPCTAISSSKAKNLDYSVAEIEKVNHIIQECQTRKISRYIVINGKPYLVTPDGIVSYEGTATMTYLQSQE